MQGFFGFNPNVAGWVAFTAGCGYLHNPTMYGTVAGATVGTGIIILICLVQTLRGK